MFEYGFIYVAGGLDPEKCRAVIPPSTIKAAMKHLNELMSDPKRKAVLCLPA